MSIQFELYYSYGQLLIFDESSDRIALEWEDEHVAQGFVRRDSVVALHMWGDHGTAFVEVLDNLPSEIDGGQRVYQLPFESNSGQITICGPDSEEDHHIEVHPGAYSLYVAVSAPRGSDVRYVRLCFEQVERLASASRILYPPELASEIGEVRDDAAYLSK